MPEIDTVALTKKCFMCLFVFSKENYASRVSFSYVKQLMSCIICPFTCKVPTFYYNITFSNADVSQTRQDIKNWSMKFFQVFMYFNLKRWKLSFRIHFESKWVTITSQ